MPRNDGIVVEVCCFDVESAVVAADCAAHRIELCSHRELDGTTPAADLLTEVLSIYAARRAASKPTPLVHVMLRPVPRGPMKDLAEQAFLLSTGDELQEILGVIDSLPDDGSVHGVVFGSIVELEPSQWAVDMDALQQVKARAEARNIHDITVHRVFDVVHDHLQAAAALDAAGVTRILVGCPPSLFDERERIAFWTTLAEACSGRLGLAVAIMPGGGLTPHIISAICASSARIHEFHGTFSGSTTSGVNRQILDDVLQLC